NAASGVQIDAAATNVRVGTDGNGVNDAAEANLISANGGHGIAVGVAGTNDTLIRGNLIGTDVTGATAFGNAADGVALYEWNYGGPSQGSPLRATVRDNTIAGNSWYGVEISGA